MTGVVSGSIALEDEVDVAVGLPDIAVAVAVAVAVGVAVAVAVGVGVGVAVVSAVDDREVVSLSVIDGVAGALVTAAVLDSAAGAGAVVSAWAVAGSRTIAAAAPHTTRRRLREPARGRESRDKTGPPVVEPGTGLGTGRGSLRTDQSASPSGRTPGAP
ncbi:hypothetical protein KUM42_12700 [Modestobacter sp. L9-4]|uniref:hypothetical protein n=1 Tax=Modestobacter sp. L9-4 TaxID=2851567 RepID=UPI001C78AE2E|nr:hypothetical protein [Modestobacter sp. L9-4]QXG74733.1 hypothetical protein KUM42_12700 [Modestobacter sp. L9-4]